MTTADAVSVSPLVPRVRVHVRAVRAAIMRHWAIVPIMALAATLYSAGLRNAGYSPFYAVAAHSMSQSWRAWLFGTIDPQASVTLDKTPGFLWPQALSARIFGFHAWALNLPQVIEGVVCVVVLYAAVITVFGRRSALLAATAFALTPIAASAFGRPMEDGLLTLCVLVAALCWQRSVRSGSWLALVACGVFVGVGFQAKMLQAWVVLVPLTLATLFLGHPRWWRRAVNALLLDVVAIAASLSWALLLVLIPAADRPYVDGTTNNNVFSMLFGYNGLNRFGINVPGAIAPVVAKVRPIDAGPLKLIRPDFYSQYGWLLPIALLGGLMSLAIAWRRRRQPRGRERLAALVLWLTWLVTTFALFSVMTLPHTAYVLALAAPIAVLFGAGVPALVALYRAGGWGRLPLPAAVLLTAWPAHTVHAAFPGFLPGVGSAELIAAAVVAGLLLLWPRRMPRPMLVAGATLAALAVLVAPAAWSLSVWTPHHDGSATDASAGVGGLRNTRPAAMTTDTVTAEQRAFIAKQRDLYRFVSTTAPHVRYPLIANAWQVLTPYLLNTPGEALPIGGFSRIVPTLSSRTFARLVRTDAARYFLLDVAWPLHQQHDSTQVARFVRGACTWLHPAPGMGRLTAPGVRLYDCAQLDAEAGVAS